MLILFREAFAETVCFHRENLRDYFGSSYYQGREFVVERCCWRKEFGIVSYCEKN